MNSTKPAADFEEQFEEMSMSSEDSVYYSVQSSLNDFCDNDATDPSIDYQGNGSDTAWNAINYYEDNSNVYVRYYADSDDDEVETVCTAVEPALNTDFEIVSDTDVTSDLDSDYFIHDPNVDEVESVCTAIDNSFDEALEMISVIDSGAHVDESNAVNHEWAVEDDTSSSSSFEKIGTSEFDDNVSVHTAIEPIIKFNETSTVAPVPQQAENAVAVSTCKGRVQKEGSSAFGFRVHNYGFALTGTFETAAGVVRVVDKVCTMFFNAELSDAIMIIFDGAEIVAVGKDKIVYESLDMMPEKTVNTLRFARTALNLMLFR